MKKVAILAAVLLCALSAGAQDTFQFAQRDSLALYLNVYEASPGSETTFQGQEKPLILFIIGGGFVRIEAGDYVYDWFDILNENGYTVASVDYRQGMKGYKVKRSMSGLIKASDQFYLSQQMAVEDLFSAVNFIVENRETLGVNPDNIVVAGSSAGAITALAAEYDIVNGRAEGLPEGFNFRGVMSFAGGIISVSGAPSYRKTPCPTLLLHGTADGAVAYRHLGALGRGIWGSDYLAGKLKKAGADYCIYRYTDRTHDVAGYMQAAWPLEKEFLERSVILNAHRVIDATIDDDSLPSWGNITTDDIY
jgi:pimeloyl-ACP methyl ester carboxylesterase